MIIGADGRRIEAAKSENCRRCGASAWLDTAGFGATGPVLVCSKCGTPREEE